MQDEIQKQAAAVRRDPNEQEKDASLVPETVLKKRKRNDAWGIARNERLALARARRAQDRKLAFKRAEQFIREFRSQENDFRRLKHVTRSKRGLSAVPKAKLLFVLRIRGANDMHPTTAKILKSLRLKHIFNGVFLEATESVLSMLKCVEPYVTYGYPNLKSIKEVIYKRGFGKSKGQRIPLTDNTVIEEALGKIGIICIEDLVHEIATVGQNFDKANNFLVPFRFNAPSDRQKMKRNHFKQGGDTGNREDEINQLIMQIN